MKKGYKQLTAVEFNNIKMMQQAGLSITQVCQITNRSNSTVNIIFKSETFEAYQETCRAYRLPKAELEQPPMLDMTATQEDRDLLNQIKEAHKHMGELLEQVGDTEPWYKKLIKKS